MSLIVTQGLLGSRLITQGMVGATTSNVFTSSGGLIFGGQSLSTLEMTPVCSGGIRLGGQYLDRRPAYHVYMNAGVGDGVNYSSPTAAQKDLSWTSDVLATPGNYRFAVRATDPASGLEEQNLDVSICLILDESGNDVTEVPPSPVGLRAFAVSGGKLRVEWSCPVAMSDMPLGFRIYVGNPAPDFSVPYATVPSSAARLGVFSVELDSLGVDQTYMLAVRSFNHAVEESSQGFLIVHTDATPPAAVESLQAIATNQES